MQTNDAHRLYLKTSELMRAGRDFEAMEVLRVAETLAPNAQGLVGLAELEREFGDPEAGLQAAYHAISLSREDPSAFIAAASCLQALGRHGEAQAVWNRAANNFPEQSDRIRLLQARTSIQQGDFAPGIEILNELIEDRPAWVPAYAQLVAGKRIGLEDAALVAKMEALLKGELRNVDRIALEYALGKVFDNLGEFENAMAHFDAANSLALSRRFDAREYAQQMAARRTSKEEIDRLKQEGSPDETPIFVVGMIRSGTTLTAQILSAHPEIANAGELRHWVNAEPGLPSGGSLSEAAEVYRRILGRFSGGSKRVVDKQPGNMVLVGMLHTAFPNARILYMTRHPADTAISIWTTQMQTSAPFVHDKRAIVQAMGEHDRLRDHWREVIPADRFLDVSYEALVTNRETETRRILEFCGLPWSDECLTPERNRATVITPSLWQARQPVYTSSIGRWKSYEPWLGDFGDLLRS